MSGHALVIIVNTLTFLAPKLSLHVRGPTWLKRVAVYMMDGTSDAPQKRNVGDHHECNAHQGHIREHQSVHGRHRVAEGQREDLVERNVGDLVAVTMDGKLVTWTNEYAGAAATSAAALLLQAPLHAPKSVDPVPTKSEKDPSPVKMASSQTFTMAKPASTGQQGKDMSGGSWMRVAYYSADQDTSEGLTFLNHVGGSPGIPGTSAGGSA